MKYPAIVILIVLLFSPYLSGQSVEEDSTTEVLSLRLKNISFIKNNEYFNPISSSPFQLTSSRPLFVDKSLWIEGYTLIGFFFQPELIYSPSSKITLRAGTHLLKYSGEDKFSEIKPLFSATLNFSENTSLTLGSLSGSDSHKLFDPHFNSERLYTEYLEDGLQFMSSNDHLFNDTWISWENFIFTGSSEREIFTFGESFRYTSSPVFSFITFEVPLQLQFKHFGGQITDYPEPVQTYFNLSAGLRINFDIADKRYGQAGIEYLYFRSNELHEQEYSAINEGNGSWIRFHYNYKWLVFCSAYWKADDFYAPNGNPVYASIVDINSDYVISDRRIWTNSAFLKIFPESFLEVLFGVETYYDICQERLNHSMTLHLNFDKYIRLAAFKKGRNRP